LITLSFRKVTSTFVKNKFEKSQYKAYPSSEPVTDLGIFGEGGRLLTATFDVMFLDGPRCIISCFKQRYLTMKIKITV
jgi:hypothetical protein